MLPPTGDGVAWEGEDALPMLAGGRHMLRVTAFSLCLVLAITFGLSFVSLARAQEPDVQIIQLDCNSEPELVVIQNLGDEAQSLSGWKLESDPPEEEVFDLFGSLQPDGKTSIALGQQFVFRDDDPTDYARIVDDTGTAVHQVNCGPAPTPTPEPSPTASPPTDVPNGGGPPPVDSTPSWGFVMLIGGAMLAVGLATFALPRLRLTPSPAVGDTVGSVPREGLAPNRPPQRREQDGRGGKPFSPASRLALIAAVTAALVILSSLRQKRSD